jgi:hypothetical protein
MFNAHTKITEVGNASVYAHFHTKPPICEDFGRRWLYIRTIKNPIVILGVLPFLPLFEAAAAGEFWGAHCWRRGAVWGKISIVSFSALPTFKRVSSAKI